MKLRPHHLMCTKAYKGNGYSREFVNNMNIITNKLRENNDVKIEIIFSTDDICMDCPNMLGINKCMTNDKVNSIDKKVIKYLSLEEKEYNYRWLSSKMNEVFNEEIIDDICSECEWYIGSKCKELIL